MRVRDDFCAVVGFLGRRVDRRNSGHLLISAALTGHTSDGLARGDGFYTLARQYIKKAP